MTKTKSVQGYLRLGKRGQKTWEKCKTELKLKSTTVFENNKNVSFYILSSQKNN